MGSDRQPEEGLEGAQQLQKAPRVPILDGIVLTGETVVGELYAGATAVRGYFTDTLFRQCTFVDCRFRRCDFEAVTFERCTFRDCDFGSSDFRSTDFIACSIVRGNFPNGSTKGCKYEQSLMEECRFYRQSFESNEVADCLIDRCSFHRSTVLHIDFIRTKFIGTRLSDCTSLYHIFEECEFVRSSINVDSIALTWGLTRDNLKTVKLVWQGRSQQRTADVELFLHELIESLMAHGWAIPTCVLALNFSLTPRLAAFDGVFAALWNNIVAGRPVRLDELQFLTRVVDRLSRQGRMPFLAIVRGMDFCARVAERDAARAEIFRALAFNLQDAEFRIIADWENIWRALSGPEDEPLEVEFTFDERPPFALVAVLQELHGAAQMAGRTPQLISAHRGSYVEIVSITLGTLMALNLALGMLVQTTGHLITLRGKGRELLSPQSKAVTRRRALEPAPTASPHLGRQIALMLGLISAGAIPVVQASAEALSEGLRQISLPHSSAPPQEP